MGGKKSIKNEKSYKNRLYSTVFARLYFFGNNLANTLVRFDFPNMMFVSKISIPMYSLGSKVTNQPSEYMDMPRFFYILYQASDRLDVSYKVFSLILLLKIGP